MLLEAYFMGLDQTTTRLQALNEYIEDTEDLVNLKLDQHRNELIGIDLVLTALSLCVAMMTAVAGYFGMNLNSGWEETPGIFNVVAVMTSSGAMLVFLGFLAFAYRRRLIVF